MQKPRFELLVVCACMLLVLPLVFTAGWAGSAEQKLYVGPVACQDCHSEQYESYLKNSRKARSWKSIEKMQPKLTAAEQRECYVCHTTGYGKPGGFVSFKETPHLASVGCESCHGPGSLHAESGDVDDIIRTPDVKGCVQCHNAERIQNFNFKPMLYHGGH